MTNINPVNSVNSAEAVNQGKFTKSEPHILASMAQLLGDKLAPNSLNFKPVPSGFHRILEFVWIHVNVLNSEITFFLMRHSTNQHWVLKSSSSHQHQIPVLAWSWQTNYLPITFISVPCCNTTWWSPGASGLCAYFGWIAMVSSGRSIRQCCYSN